MATRKSVSKSKLKPVKAKVSKAAPAKKVAGTPAPESPASPLVKDVRAVVAAPVKQKIKLVRDSFTMSKSEFLSLSDLKLRSARIGLPAKKSDILRAGLALLSKMSDTGFAAALDAIPSLKPARKKDAKKDAAK